MLFGDDMTLDATFRPLAHNLIAKYGKNVTFTKTTAGTFDPVTGTTIGSTSTDTVVKIAPPAAVDVAEVNGTSIQTGDLKVSVAALDYTPDINQTVTIDGATYDVVSVSPVYSGELVALYDCQVRK